MNPIAFTTAFSSPRTSFGTATVSTTPTYQHSPIPPAADTVSFGTTRVRFGEYSISNQDVRSYLSTLERVYPNLLDPDKSVLGIECPSLNLEFPIFIDPQSSPLARRLFGHTESASAKLIGLQARCVNLEGAFFSHSNLERADFSFANLKEAHLNHANLHESIFKETSLENANLFNANLTFADLRAAKLNMATLEKANLASANLQKARLDTTNFITANLTSADLREATLNGAEFDHANLSGADFTYTITDNKTTWKGAYYERGNPPKGLSDGVMNQLSVKDSL